MEYRPSIISDRYRRGAAHATALSDPAELELRAVLDKFTSRGYEFNDRTCEVCEGKSFDILAEQDRYGLPIQTTLCQSCGLIQTNPDMRMSDYTDFYTHHYRKLYIAELVGEPEDFFREELWRGQRIGAFIKKAVRLPKGSLIVEVGCGAGGILHFFSTLGHRVIGTDLGIENMSYGRSRGLDLRTGDVFNLQLPEAPSLVIFSHVLEHIREPGNALEQVRKWLGRDGYLYVEVPGVKDVQRNLFQGDFLRTFHLAHIYNFTLRSLTNLLGKHGYELIAGNEVVRTLSKPGARTVRFESDYRDVMKYINASEKWRALFSFRFRIKSRLLGIWYAVRSVAIGILKRMNLDRALRRAGGAD